MRSRLLLVLCLGIGSLVLLMGLTGLGVMRQAGQMTQRFEMAQRSYLEAEDLLRDIPAEIHLAGILVRDYLLDPSPAAAPEYKARLIEHQRLIEGRLNKLAGGPAVEEAQALRKLRDEVKAYLDSLDPMLAWSQGEKAYLGHAFVRQNVIPRRDSVIAIASELNALNLRNLQSGQDRAKKDQARLMTFLKWMLWGALALGLVVAAVTIGWAARLERRAEEERERAERAETEQRRLARQIVKAQEQERKFLSLELHDAIGQTLSAVGMELGNLEKLRDGPASRFQALMDEIKKLNTGAVRAVKDLAAGLRPATLDELGLGPALRAHAREFSRRGGVPVDVRIDGELTELPEDHRTCVFRIVQEALANCAKHSRARTVRIAVYGRRDLVRLTIQDDGEGFDTQAPRRGLGLVGIQERVRDLGGRATIGSQPGAGTVLEIELPVAVEAVA